MTWPRLGRAVYVQTLEEQREELAASLGPSSLVFTSALGLGPEGREALAQVSALAHGVGAWLVCDVDGATVERLGFPGLQELQQELGVDMLRLDDGFSADEVRFLAERGLVCVNASTANDDLRSSLRDNPGVLFLHNFYPHRDTGLDLGTFATLSRGVPTGQLAAFVNGEGTLRGPLHEGLVTLEHHRGRDPFVNLLELTALGVGTVVVGDPSLSEATRRRMTLFLEKGVVTLPVQWEADPGPLAGQVWQVRRDSPAQLKRLVGTRGLASPAPGRPGLRTAGTVTMDNEGYGRYAGEVSLVVRSLPRDWRVNRIGRLAPGYEALASLLPPGASVLFEGQPSRGG